MLLFRIGARTDGDSWERQLRSSMFVSLHETTETRQLDRLGQLGVFEQESNTESQQERNADSHSARSKAQTSLASLVAASALYQGLAWVFASHSDAASQPAQPDRKVPGKEEPKHSTCPKRSTKATTSHCGNTRKGTAKQFKEQGTQQI